MQELKKYIEEKCEKCKHKNINLCEIRKKIDGSWSCKYYERDK